MTKWNISEVRKVVKFNPKESLPKGCLAKKIPMESLTAWQKKIGDAEVVPYNGGPKFRNGDTLVAKITPCLENGKTAFVDVLGEDEVAFGSTEFIVLRATKDGDAEFVYYFARSPSFRKRAISCMEGTSGRKRVNENALQLCELPCPPKSEQKKIAATLSALDAKIDLNNRINAELEMMAKKIYDYWFVQFDFPDSNGRPYKTGGGKMLRNDTLKREIPAGWGAGSLDDLGRIVGGSTPSTANPDHFGKGMIPWITPKDLSNNKGNKFIARGEIDVSEAGRRNASLTQHPAGTVLMSSRAPVGYLAIALNPVTTNQGFKSFVPSKGYGTSFVYYVVKRSLPTIIQYASGSTFVEISGGVLKSVRAVLPNRSVTDAFCDLIEPLVKRQQQAELENIELTELRDWLLPLLMNGQVRVTT